MFLFNSALSAALLAFITSPYGPRGDFAISNIKLAIGIFLFVAAFAILLFCFGYLINLRHGNSYKQNSNSSATKIWKSANILQIIVYVILFIIIALWFWGFYVMFQGMM